MKNNFSAIPSTKKHEVRKIKKMYVKVEKKKFQHKKLYRNCQKSPGRKFKLNNKVAIFTFSKFFLHIVFGIILC